MAKGIKRKHCIIAVCISFVVVWVGLNLFWGFDNYVISGEDTANYLVFSVEFHEKVTDIITSGDLFFTQKIFYGIQLIFTPMPQSAGRYTSLIYLITAPFYSFFGSSLGAARLSNIVSILLLVTAVYLIGKKIFGAGTALLSVFFVLMHPFIYESARQYGLDLILTALTALSMYVLIKNDGFISTKSILWGVLTGVAIFFKPQILVFVSLPAVLYLYHNMKSGVQVRELLLNFLASALVISIFLLLFLLYWRLNDAGFSMMVSDGEVYYSHLFHYFKNLIFAVGGIPFVILLIPGIRRLMKSGGSISPAFLTWLFFPPFLFMLFFVFAFYSDRFLMPVIPAVAVLSAAGLKEIRKKYRKICLPAVIIFLFAQFYYLSFVSEMYGFDIQYCGYPEYFRKRGVSLFNGSSHGAPALRGDRLNMGEIVEKVDAASGVQDDKVYIISVSLTSGNPRAFEQRYWFRLAGEKFDLVDFSVMFYCAYNNLKKHNVDFILFRTEKKHDVDILPNYNEFISKLKDSMDKPPYLLYSQNVDKKTKRDMYELLKHHYMRTELITRLPAEDGFWWHLYKVRA